MDLSKPKIWTLRGEFGTEDYNTIRDAANKKRRSMKTFAEEVLIQVARAIVAPPLPSTPKPALAQEPPKTFERKENGTETQDEALRALEESDEQEEDIMDFARNP